MPRNQRHLTSGREAVWMCLAAVLVVPVLMVWYAYCALNMLSLSDGVMPDKTYPEHTNAMSDQMHNNRNVIPSAWSLGTTSPLHSLGHWHLRQKVGGGKEKCSQSKEGLGYAKPLSNPKGCLIVCHNMKHGYYLYIHRVYLAKLVGENEP